MKYQFSYEELLQICPTEVKTVLNKIKSGKSKSKDLPPEDFEWSIQLGKVMHAYTFNEMINNVDKGIIPFDERYVANLSAKKNRSWASCSLSPLPDVIVADLVAKELTK